MFAGGISLGPRADGGANSTATHKAGCAASRFNRTICHFRMVNASRCTFSSINGPHLSFLDQFTKSDQSLTPFTEDLPASQAQKDTANLSKLLNIQINLFFVIIVAV
jgi:hypothetical protein